MLDNVSLDVSSGDRIALIGSNGAGKTTLIRCLLGEYVYSGKIRIDQLEPRTQRQTLLKNVGFVPQLPPPLKMPVGQLISFAAGVCNSNPNEMFEVASYLGLDAAEIKKQPFVKLSGGQKQKLLISIALGRKTKLLIMDEPAANLDPDARHSLFSILAERKDSGVMFISSHRLDEVSSLVNRVIELDQGRVVLDDNVAEELDINRLLRCEVVLTRADLAIGKTLSEWGFDSSDDEIVWSGRVAGPDRLRFLGVLSRYAGLLKGVDIRDRTV